MPATMRSLVYLALGFAIFVNLLSAQHWSFDLRPGGKRAGGDLLEPLQDAAMDADELMNNQMVEFPPPDYLGNTLAKFTPRRKKF
ncbi:progonadoliberin-1-like [Mustelus asterias]